MKDWRTQGDPAQDQDRLHAEQTEKLKDERAFWSDCVRYMIDEGMTETEVQRAISGADRIIEARRERFPV